ncbi:MAG: stage V sporulation protein AD [Clostridia bacterium]|nr:stage V sporulation protein AD [Clostridia bacterium]
MEKGNMGNQTIYFKKQPRIVATSSIAGPKECEGIIGRYVETALMDDMFGESTYEKAECKMLSHVIHGAISNAGFNRDEVDMIVSGDLLNQIISSSFAARDFSVPFLGVYGACSTMAESLAVAAAFIDGGFCKRIVAATGSHFASAERQYRYPLELGCTRPPQAQWTVTGAGGALVADKGDGIRITGATLGKVVDYGVTDVNNMGAAMAPAAADTILAHFRGTKEDLDSYDLIVTGDLGALGSRILKDLTWEKGLDISKNHVDCGEIIYNVIEDEFQGGSGAGCSAVVLNSYLHAKMMSGGLKKILFVATGALLSPVSSGQGESIPCIAHAVVLER